MLKSHPPPCFLIPIMYPHVTFYIVYCIYIVYKYSLYIFITYCTIYIILYINPVSDIWFWPLSEWPGCYFWWPAWLWPRRGGGSRPAARRWRAWWRGRWRAWWRGRGGDWLTGLGGEPVNPLKLQSEGSRAFRGGSAKLRWAKNSLEHDW